MSKAPKTADQLTNDESETGKAGSGGVEVIDCEDKKEDENAHSRKDTDKEVGRMRSLDSCSCQNQNFSVCSPEAQSTVAGVQVQEPTEQKAELGEATGTARRVGC